MSTRSAGLAAPHRGSSTEGRQRARRHASAAMLLLLLAPASAARRRATAPSSSEPAGEFARAALSGGMAAAAATVALHPVDTVKTVLQQGGQVKLRGLYRGVVPAALSMMPACAVRMGAYETFKTQLLIARPFPALLPAPGLIALSSALSVVVSAIVRSPLDMIKTQVQTGAAESVRVALRAACADGGAVAVSNFYRGAHLTLLRDVPFFTLNLVIYEELKAAAVRRRVQAAEEAAAARTPASSMRTLTVSSGGAPAANGGAIKRADAQTADAQPSCSSSGPAAGSLASSEAIWLGAVAQGVAGFATNPVDVLKTRVQSGASSGMRNALADVLRAGGPRALMRGAGMRTIWIMPQGCVYYPVYEGVQRLLNSKRPFKKGVPCETSDESDRTSVEVQ